MAKRPVGEPSMEGPDGTKSELRKNRRPWLAPNSRYVKERAREWHRIPVM